MRAKVTKHMISFVPVRRGEWIFKISVWKTKTVLVVAQHEIDLHKIYVEYFQNQNDAADFIERLANEE
jgi:hypothetical protein